MKSPVQVAKDANGKPLPKPARQSNMKILTRAMAGNRLRRGGSR